MTETEIESKELSGGTPIEGVYATINPATCGGRIEIQCSAMGCEERAGLVHRIPIGDQKVMTAIPYCNDHLVEVSTT